MLVTGGVESPLGSI